MLLGLYLLLPALSQAQKSRVITHIDVLSRATALNLAPVDTLIPSIRIDLKYASSANITRHALYPPDMPCLLHRMTLSRLKQAQKFLLKKKLSLKVWDAYRPPAAHRQLWSASKNFSYLVPPEMGLSLHCYGVAVDVTLVNQYGQELLMPSRHDEFSPTASSTYTGANKVILRNLKTLQKAMKKAGFSTIKDEWWHFTNMEPASARIVTAQQLGIQLPTATTLKATPVPIAQP